jgi:hypothetical protein
MWNGSYLRRCQLILDRARVASLGHELEWKLLCIFVARISYYLYLFKTAGKFVLSRSWVYKEAIFFLLLMILCNISGKRNRKKKTPSETSMVFLGYFALQITGEFQV